MYRVLLVEDEEIELETLRDYIDWKKNGISRVFTARNGRRALECLEENMADIVITDIQMPGMSGIELAETIVRRGYPCKIVFLTGYDDFSYIHSAFQVNAVDYLLKPFTIEEVEANGGEAVAGNGFAGKTGNRAFTEKFPWCIWRRTGRVQVWNHSGLWKNGRKHL